MSAFQTDGVQVMVPIANHTAWITAHAYTVGTFVKAGAPLDVYRCAIDHTSGTFATDLAAGKWVAERQPLEKVTPYLEADLSTIQYCQINDLMYMTHPNYPPQKLTRVADDNWTFAEVAFKWPPLLEENSQNINITLSGTSGNITMAATSPIWSQDDVGSIWQIGHNMAGATQTWVEVALGLTTANSAAIRVRGPWSFTTYGTWSGEVRIVRTIFETGVVETIRTYHNTVDGQRNVATSGNEDKDCSMYIAFITGGTGWFL